MTCRFAAVGTNVGVTVLKVALKKKKAETGRQIFFVVILLTPMFGFLLVSFTAAGVEEGFPYRHYRKAKRKRCSSWAQSRRATALLLWIIHSHSDRTWMAWLQLLTCAITLTLSITPSPSLTPSQTHMRWKADTQPMLSTQDNFMRVCESW